MPTVKIVPFPGAPGPTGPAGEQGPRGYQGDTGLTGIAGQNGDATLYTPSVSENWNSEPTTISGALDEIASRLKALES